ncbi:hypothetical protein FOA43_002450 [Brettanomyces nanus]|uniref:Major facilitator superfamily (MFS) profile domain-containing protein n=1 Tax=Eeniella nana TaxID=13502 RepID=A0A875S5T2_EENNA|nr:uncharacterized protein FOA43_002450 [Brettanomyces nanus]QPG75109.1 hypothetical protein FOA43_002450 [Brettanomyces nanus]
MIMEGVCYKVNQGRDQPYQCDSPFIQKTNAQVQKWLSLTAIINILVSGKVGQMSDTHGRKPVILFIIACDLVGFIVILVVLTPRYFSARLLFLGGSIQSMGGSIFVLMGVSDSYIVDVVVKQHRMQAMGKLVAFMTFGMGLGPLSASIANLSPRYTLLVSVLLRVFALALVVLFLPESRSAKLRAKARRRLSRERRMSDEQIQHTFSVSGIVNLLGLNQLIDSLKSIKLLWISRHPDRLDYIDRTYLVVALLCEIGMQTMGVIANTTAGFLMIAPFMAFASLGTPTLHSALIKYSPSSAKNGEFFGALALFTNIIILQSIQS